MLRWLVAAKSHAAPHDTIFVDASGAVTWKDLEVWAAEYQRELGNLPTTARLAFLVPQRATSVSLLAALDALGAEVLLLPELYGEMAARRLAHENQASQLLTLCGRELVSLFSDGDVPRGSTTRRSGSVLLLTSGTTGRPKCARHTWETLGADARVRARYARTRWLLGYPMANFSGLQVLLQCLSNNATIVLPCDFGADTSLRAIVEHEVAYLTCTPTYARQLLVTARPEDWSDCRIKQVTLGGEIADQKLLDWLYSVLPKARLTHVYASTEAGASISVSDGKAGFDASFIDGERLRVVDGQLQVRRSQRSMLGYLGRQDPPATWVETGDLVEVREGRAFFLGRADHTINIGGAKVQPAIVENVIRTVEGVLDTRVVPHRSSIAGNLLKACVWHAAGTAQEDLRSRIQAVCRSQLPGYMMPRLFEFVEKPALTVSQKMKA